jgi:hypothetical protein
VKRIRVGEYAHARARQRHKSYRISSEWGATCSKQNIANTRGENHDADRNAGQQDGKGNSGWRAYFSNLTDGLANVAVARNSQRQCDCAEAKKGCGQGSKQQSIVSPHLQSPGGNQQQRITRDHPQTRASQCTDSLLARRVLKDRFNWRPENGGDPKCDLERRGIFSLFDRVDSLARDPDSIGEFALCHLTMIEPQPPNVVSN